MMHRTEGAEQRQRLALAVAEEALKLGVLVTLSGEYCALAAVVVARSDIAREVASAIIQHLWFAPGRTLRHTMPVNEHVFFVVDQAGQNAALLERRTR